MGRKRKNEDAAVARITRPQPSVPRTRIVSMHTTATGRVGQSTSFLGVVPPPSVQAESSGADKSHGQDESDFANEADFFEASDPVEDNSGGTPGPTDPSAKSTPLLDWVKNHRQAYLDELIRHDGRAGVVDCAKCGQPGFYKCKECLGFQILCSTCFLEQHTYLPLHRALVRRSVFLLVGFLTLCSTGMASILMTFRSSHLA